MRRRTAEDASGVGRARRLRSKFGSGFGRGLRRLARLGVSRAWLAGLILTLSSGLAAAEDPKQSLRYGLEEGLSQIGALSVVQTRDGRIWIATGEGVTILTGGPVGYLFRSEDPEQGLRSDYVYGLFRDRDDEVWVGTSGGGASLYSGRDAEEGPRFLGHAPGDEELERRLDALDVFSFAQDAAGRVWIASAAGVFIVRKEGGRILFDPESRALAEFEGDLIYRIHPLAGGAALIGTERRGLWLYDPAASGARQISSAGPDAPQGLGDEVRATLQDREGRIWVGFNSTTDRIEAGVRLYDPAEGALKPAPIRFPAGISGVMSAAQGDDGRIWFGTRKAGIFVLDPDSGAVEQYAAEEGEASRLSNPHVSALTPDSMGRMWAGTWDGGLNSFAMPPDVFETYLPSPQRRPTGIPRLTWALQEHEGGLWIGARGGLARLDLRTREMVVVAPSKETRGKAIWSLFADGDRLLLGVGDSSGLFAYEPKTGLTRPVLGEDGENLLKRTTIRLFLRDAEGHIWVGTNADGLFKLDAEARRVLAHYGAEPGEDGSPAVLPGRQIRALSQRADGRLWIGANAGLALFDPQTETSRIYAGPDQFPDDNVRAVHEAEDGRVFVATGGGLGILTAEMEPISFIRSVGAFRSKMLYSLIPDDFGQLWITTNNGLVRYDVASGAAEGFRASDGLQSREFNFNAFARLSDGRIAVGGVRGISIFDPARLEINRIPPALSLTIGAREAAAAERGEAPSGPPLDFGAAPQSLSYRIGVRHYDDQQANKLRVQLWPLEAAPREILGSQHDLHHDNLPAGLYELRYAGVSPSGAETETRILKFVVQPAFYARWYMILAYILAGLAISAGVARLRTRQIRRRNAELEAAIAEKTQALQQSNQALQAQAAERAGFYARASHEIRTPLSLIRAPVRALIEEDPPQAERRDLARLVSRASDRLLQLSDEMMAVAKDGDRMSLGSATVDLRAFLEPICQLYAESARLKGMELSYEIQGPRAATFDLAAAETVLHNLLSNAVKHGAAPMKLRLLAALRGEALEIRVADDGPGLPEDLVRRLRNFREESRGGPQDPPPSHGLEILAAAILKAGGDLQVDPQAREIAAFLPAHAQGAPQEAEAPQTFAAPPLPAAEDSAEEKSAEAALEERFILIVEDDRDLREYLSALVRPLAPVHAVASVAAARRALERLPIDLALCDVMLPDGSGFDFARHLKTHEDLSHTPLIFLTALTDLDSSRSALEVWADDYLTKPFDPEELLKRIGLRLRAQKETRAQLLKELRPAAAAKAEEPAADSEAPEAPARLAPLDRRISKAFQSFLDEKHRDPDVDLAQAASACGLSPRSLQRKLDALYGKSFSALLIQRRMDQAQKLLAEGYGVGETAEASGYRNLASFSRQFKTSLGVTPSEFAERARSGEAQPV